MDAKLGIALSADTLVLGGGGAKCIATLGALQFMYDKGFGAGVAKYIGTSAGAITGLLLAVGYTPIEIMVYICTHGVAESLLPLDFVALVTGRGAVPFARLETHIRAMLAAKLGADSLALGALRAGRGKTLVCATYNLTENRVEYVSPDTHPDLDAVHAVRMSASLPLVFDECVHGACVYLDGGIADNFPIAAAAPADRVFGIMVTPRYHRLGEQNRLLTLLRIAVSVSSNFYIERALAAHEPRAAVLRIPVDGDNILALDTPSSAKLDVFSHGYNTCSMFFADKSK